MNQIREEKSGNFTFRYFPGYIEIIYKQNENVKFIHTVINENEKRIFVSGFREALHLASGAIQNLM